MLEIRNLEKSFGNKQVLFGVDLTAQQGHILGLVGKNGAGKTTIFHSILRFLDYSGEIRLDGKAITQETSKKLVICRKSVVSCQNSRFLSRSAIWLP